MRLGVRGKPELSIVSAEQEKNLDLVPWKAAVADARKLREAVGNENDPIETDKIFELLGIASSDKDKWSFEGRSSVSVGIPENHQSIKFIPRKKPSYQQAF